MNFGIAVREGLLAALIMFAVPIGATLAFRWRQAALLSPLVRSVAALAEAAEHKKSYFSMLLKS
jgi:hypothetical protein